MKKSAQSVHTLADCSKSKSGFEPLLINFFETLKKGFLTWIAWMKKVEELKDLGCSVRGRFYDLAWSKPVLRAPAVHGVSSN